MTDQVSNDVLAERLEGVRGDISEIKAVVKEMSATMSKLVDVERRQSDQQAMLQKHEERLGAIEVRLPGLVEMRAWFIGGMLTVVGAVIWAALSGHIH